MLSKLSNITGNTFIEAIRQPIYVVLLLTGMLALMFNLSMAAYTLDNDNKLLVEVGLSTILVIGVFLVAFTAAGAISREIDNKTVLTVISKPVGRPIFVIGKFLGVSAAMSMAFWAWAIVFLLTVRHGVLEEAAQDFDYAVVIFGFLGLLLATALSIWGNYFYNWVFGSTFSRLLTLCLTFSYLLVLMIGKDGLPQPITHDIDPQLLLALLLAWEGLIVASAIAVAVSVRLKLVMTLMISAALLLLGLVSEYLLGRYTHFSARIGQALLPDMQLIWLADALNLKHPANASYILLVSAYCALFTIAAVSIGVALFQGRQTS